MDGEWYLSGCAKDDPSRFRTVEDVILKIRENGFLPLFATSVPGFSVEEHTWAHDWWSDDPRRDPWIWRQIIAEESDIAYGKFFDKKAGFISKEWFPAFANFRRDGYDYEGMYEDGKLNGRAKRILDSLELNENAEGMALMSFELKRKSAVDKGFDGTVIDLQMQSFLLISGFRQKRNKRGECYGWHLPVFTTPESKWGYDAVNNCDEKPEESGRSVFERLKTLCPYAPEQEIRKLAGIRRR